MDFDLSKSQKLLKQSARDLLARECKPARVREIMATETAFDESIWQSIAGQGWMGLIVPEVHGGLAVGIVELAAVFEETGRVCMPGPLLSTTFATALIAALGSAEQQARYLEPIAAGTMKATVAVLEQSANWDLSAINCTASLSREAFVLSGEKHFVFDATIADVILCVARSGDEILVLPVERNAAGVTVKPAPSMDETRKVATVTFDNVRVDRRSALRGDVATLSAAVDLATTALCAEMVGGMQWILETTVEFAKTRQQFGRPIGSFQAVQHQCADMLLLTESSRSATYYAAWALTHDDPFARAAVSIAKAYCSDACREVGNRGIQVHGGIGFTWEHDLQLYYKRSKSAETLFGDATFHRERLAQQVIDPSVPVNAAPISETSTATVWR